MAKKIDIINSAYTKLRISGITVSPSAENIEKALIRLEEMMALFEPTLCVNYRFETTPNPNTETGADRVHDAMMSSNLAVQ